MDRLYFDPKSELERKQNERINAQKAAWDVITTGEVIPGASINGRPITKCSHGGVCYQELLRNMQQ
jgi:hypothetical protein